MEWCQEDVDELFVAFEKNSTLPVEELLRCITQDISDKNIHKSEQEVGFFSYDLSIFLSGHPYHWNTGVYNGTFWAKSIFTRNKTYFGLKSAPRFSTLTNFIVGCIQKRGYEKLFCCLDDYHALGRTTICQDCPQKRMALIN